LGPQKLFLPLLPAAAGGGQKSEKWGNCSTLRVKGWLPFTILLVEPLEWHRTPVRKIRGNSWTSKPISTFPTVSNFEKP
jgi:hypothetical protein